MRHSPLTDWPPLVAVAHGSSDPRAAATITDLAGAVAARARAAGLPQLQMRVAYLGHALPSVPRVLESLGGERGVVVLPLLLTPAYHSDTDLPAVLRETGRRLAGLRICYGQPLGPHPWLLRALDRRVAEATAGTGDLRAADTAVVLAAAGSGRPDANDAVARIAEAWQVSRGWRAVVPAYASAASPSPGQAVAEVRNSGAATVIVASYLLAPGYFADKIREQSLAAGAVAVTAPLGAAPEVARLVVRRYLHAAAAGGLAAAGSEPSSLFDLQMLKWEHGARDDASGDAPSCPPPRHARGDQPGSAAHPGHG